MAQSDKRPTETPTDDVKLDPKALKDAEKDMHAGGTGGDYEDDPTHDHGKEALEKGAKGMHAK
jgi:hypothetical protein